MLFHLFDGHIILESTLLTFAFPVRNTSKHSFCPAVFHVIDDSIGDTDSACFEVMIFGVFYNVAIFKSNIYICGRFCRNDDHCLSTVCKACLSDSCFNVFDGDSITGLCNISVTDGPIIRLFRGTILKFHGYIGVFLPIDNFNFFTFIIINSSI